jgi:hypothetical protein
MIGLGGVGREIQLDKLGETVRHQGEVAPNRFGEKPQFNAATGRVKHH